MAAKLAFVLLASLLVLQAVSAQRSWSDSASSEESDELQQQAPVPNNRWGGLGLRQLLARNRDSTISASSSNTNRPGQQEQRGGRDVNLSLTQGGQQGGPQRGQQQQGGPQRGQQQQGGPQRGQQQQGGPQRGQQQQGGPQRDQQQQGGPQRGQQQQVSQQRSLQLQQQGGQQRGQQQQGGPQRGQQQQVSQQRSLQLQQQGGQQRLGLSLSLEKQRISEKKLVAKRNIEKLNEASKSIAKSIETLSASNTTCVAKKLVAVNVQLDIAVDIVKKVEKSLKSIEKSLKSIEKAVEEDSSEESSESSSSSSSESSESSQAGQAREKTEDSYLQFLEDSFMDSFDDSDY